MNNIQKQLIEYAKNHQLDDLNNLLETNPDISLLFTDNKGKTLLHFAAGHISEKGLPVLQVLLEKNIDPCSLDENFESPMDVAKNINNIPGLTLIKHFMNKHNQELQSYL